MRQVWHAQQVLVAYERQREAIVTMTRALFTLACVGALYGCSGPMGPVAGGKLEGEVAPWPEDWGLSDNVENVLLETRPNDPYSVTLWGVYRDRDFIVGAAELDNRWAQNILADPRVVLAIEGVLYEGRAELVSATDENTAIADLFMRKYEIEDWEEFTGDREGAFFRISAR